MIYIAGQITGLPVAQVDEKFQEAEQRLHALGVKVINPMKLGIPHSWTHEEQLAKCLEVIEQRATAIFLLDDWRESRGAKMEFMHVCQLNNRRRNAEKIQIYFEDFHGYDEVMLDVKNQFITCLLPENCLVND